MHIILRDYETEGLDDGRIEQTLAALRRYFGEVAEKGEVTFEAVKQGKGRAVALFYHARQSKDVGMDVMTCRNVARSILGPVF